MAGLGLAAAGLTFILPNLTRTFTIVTGIGAVTVPVASTIMAMDVFVLPRLFRLRRPLHRVPSWSELAPANWPAIVALLAGTAVGAYTGGLIPGASGFGKTYIGFPALQAWATGAVVYLVAVALVARGARATELLGYSGVAEVPTMGTAAAAVADWPRAWISSSGRPASSVTGGRWPASSGFEAGASRPSSRWTLWQPP